MRVWLMHVSEELPMDGSARTFRYGYLARALQEHGHSVLRWAPTFRHRTKEHRFTSDQRVAISPGYEIQFVHSPGYQRHISFERLKTYQVLRERFEQLAAHEPQPDLIVSAIPSLEWAEAAVNFGNQHNVPVVIDVRDIWPDIYLNALPRWLRPLGKLLLTKHFQAASRTCRGASMLTGVSDGYVDWAADLAGRQRTDRDVTLPLGFDLPQFPANVVNEKLDGLRRQGIDFEKKICMFAGRFERSYDLFTVIEAAKRLNARGPNDFEFVFCGGGADDVKLRRAARNVPNIHFLGWVDGPTLQAVSSVATIGLCAYASDATQSIPNKPFEYMASRLVVLSSLAGEMDELLRRYQCGLTYKSGDANSLAYHLQILADDPQQADAMRQNGFDAWNESYRSDAIYSNFVEHLTHHLLPRPALAA